MVTIRHDQMQAFSEAAARSFEDRMVVHLEKFFPQQCKALGEQRTRDVIRLGIERAARHDIDVEYDVCRYIDLMFVFGERYDEDPAWPWASRILGDKGASQRARVDRLWDRARAAIWRLACTQPRS